MLEMALGTNFDMRRNMNTRAKVFDDRLREQNGNLENRLTNELGFHYQTYDRNERERGLNMYRSGSAPPTIEGSYNVLSSLFKNLDFPNGGFSEEEMRTHPAYLSYYYSHDNNINPRLPPPLLSKEEWRMHQRLRGGGLSCGQLPDWRNLGLDDERADDLSLPALSLQKENYMIIDNHSAMNFTNQASFPWIDNRDHDLVRHGVVALGVRRKSFADILQEGSSRPPGLSGPIPCHANRNASYDFSYHCNSNFQQPELLNGLEAIEGHSGEASNMGRYFSRKVTNIAGSNVTNGKSSSMNNLSDFASGLSLSRLEHLQNGLGDNGKLAKSHFVQGKSHQVNFQSDIPISQQQQLCGRSRDQRLIAPLDYPLSKPPVILPSKANSMMIRDLNEQNSYNNTRILVKHGPGGHPDNPNLTTGANNPLGSGGQFPGMCGNNMQLDHHYQPTDPADAQYYRHPANQNLLLGGKYISATHSELSELQRTELDTLLSEQQKYGPLFLQNSHGGMNDGYYEGLAYLLGMPYQGVSMANTLSDVWFGNCMLQCDIPASVKGMARKTLLEEFKNKSRPFELSNIVGHVVEFSKDQCGSRFIQHKLETSTNEEKTKVFPEIASHARALMSDVFGNYVIQKFFERGTKSQRSILAGKIKSHVLQLSFQMYGCRVIQKALETLDVDEKTQLVVELDCSVLKCVRDQNGNHVIQKCIECIPEDRIQFMITSFFGQVVSLSSHPYGCRVIQRVLEHSSSEDTQKRIIQEIMQSICTLAQDEYGNYVIQHVIQHGKPEERSIIINILATQIVQMSQQKFASNVIEKCLTFGTPEERQVLVNEMLRSTDVNEPLQNMMKDPFGNYVVQKVLETCDEQTRELILSCIKLHLCNLKKYTYVKHVVSRVEKLLITAGERAPVHKQ